MCLYVTGRPNRRPGGKYGPYKMTRTGWTRSATAAMRWAPASRLEQLEAKGWPSAHRTSLFHHDAYISKLEALKSYRLQHVGRDWTEEAMVNYVQFALMMMSVLHVSKEYACQFLSLSGRSYVMVLRMLNSWLEKDELGYVAPNKRGAGSPRYQLSDPAKRHTKLEQYHQLQISAWMDGQRKQGVLVTAPAIQCFLTRVGVLVGYKRLCRQLKAWGGRYKRAVEAIAVDKV